jgi:hypothetical protein
MKSAGAKIFGAIAVAVVTGVLAFFSGKELQRQDESAKRMERANIESNALLSDWNSMEMRRARDGASLVIEEIKAQRLRRDDADIDVALSIFPRSAESARKLEIDLSETERHHLEQMLAYFDDIYTRFNAGTINRGNLSRALGTHANFWHGAFIELESTNLRFMSGFVRRARLGALALCSPSLSLEQVTTADQCIFDEFTDAVAIEAAAPAEAVSEESTSNAEAVE